MTEHWDDVIVIGDGPAGLTAALYLSKNDMSVRVIGQDRTPMHKALLHNQPGAPDTPGSDFVSTTRDQCRGFGTHLEEAEAVSVTRDGDAFVARTDDGVSFRARYLVLATGRDRHLADALGLEGDETVRVDMRGRTSVDRVYAGGNLSRGLTQAVISAGDGAVIALDILSREHGKPFYDYDVVRAPSRVQRAA